MSEIEIINVSNLLNQVGIIKKKYDDLAEYTGENYNIFNVLNIYSDELSHSAIIGDLLNAKGKHGQKDIFLKLFLEEINSFNEETNQFKILNEFNTSNSHSVIEKHIGKVNYEIEEGGRIDILINDGKNNIIIENKIWAGDQEKQLVRYNKQDKKAPIIYLTLNGKEPSNESKGNLILNKDFICMSYRVEIINWLEKCVKEMANKPIIRESLNQYLVLVKQLTHQSINNKMKEEIIKIITSNPNNVISAKNIYENYMESIRKLYLDQTLKLLDKLNEKGLNIDKNNIERSSRGDGDGLFIPLKDFILDDGEFELGINIEMTNNYFFFCVLRKNEKRQDSVNKLPKFEFIKKYLHERVEGLSIYNNWTIGKANNYYIGLNQNEYFLPNKDNSEVYDEFALKILKLKDKLKI